MNSQNITVDAISASAARSTSAALTVIMPSYNSAKHIEVAFQSLLAQTVLPAEILVVDAGSTDGTEEIVTRYARQLPLRFISAPNTSIGPARNIGIREATSDIVCFLDTDDAYLSHRIELAADVFATTPDIEVVHGYNLQWLLSSGEYFLGYDYAQASDTEVEIFGHSLINLSALTVRKSFLLGHQIFFRHDCCSRYGEDWDFCARIFSKGPRASALRLPVSVVTMRSDSHTQPNIRWKMRLCTLKTLEACAPAVLARRTDAVTRKRILRALDVWRLKTILTLLQAKRPYTGRIIARRVNSPNLRITALIMATLYRWFPAVISYGINMLNNRHTAAMRWPLEQDISVEPIFSVLRERVA